jgi:alpha-D-ribose 1-methylphosphonate 5-triphosphate diphosphatase
MRTYLTNCRAVLKEELLEDAALVIEDDHIAEINPFNPVVHGTLDLEHALVIPGMIDLHCDQIEKLVAPRAGVYLDAGLALAESDRRNVACGITTTFQSISFAHDELGIRNDEIAKDLVESVRVFREEALIDHRVHCRYEITDFYGLDMLLGLIDRGLVDLVSLMDHTPGRRQFRDNRSYEIYVENAYSISTEKARELIKAKAKNFPGALGRMETLIAKARKLNVPIASHDDDSTEQVEYIRGRGASICEFPVTLEAASAAHQGGLKTVFGSPNIVRGKSQNGSLRAIDAVQHDVIDCLCSDYYPATLLPAVMRITELAGWCLPKAVRLTTANPAEAAGLRDRGEIASGKRADIIVVCIKDGRPQITHSWVAGRLAYHAQFPRRNE